MSGAVLVNGTVAASIGVLDRGLHYGDGLFETVALRRGRIRLLSYHQERLESGCRRLGLQAPPRKLLAAEMAAVAPGRDAVIKVIVTRGASPRGYRPAPVPDQTRIVMGCDSPVLPHAWYRDGVRARTCATPRGDQPALAGLKHLGRLENVLARAEWQDESVVEGLMLDLRGRVAGGTQSNVFVERRGRLLTPAVDRGGVAGVMRRAVLEWARGCGKTVGETAIRPDELFEADEVFFTSAVIGAWRVAELDGRRLGRTGAAQDFMAWLDSR